jgi:RNA polymerase sigma-70 factor (ECF subfamily)
MDFSFVYQEYQPKIIRYLTHFSGETEAADLTQTIFLKVSQSLDGFRG